MKTTPIKRPACRLIATKTCESSYTVGEHKVRLWMISGGTPAIDFMGGEFECGFVKRYPKVELWSNDHWQGCKYDHQSLEKMQGPTFDILPNGKQDLIDFVTEFAPLREKRWERFDALPIRGCSSPRFHDTYRNCYFRVDFEASPHSVGSLTANSNFIGTVAAQDRLYGGPCRQEIAEFANVAWSSFAALLDELNPVYEVGWESLSEKDFARVQEAIRAVM